MAPWTCVGEAVGWGEVRDLLVRYTEQSAGITLAYAQVLHQCASSLGERLLFGSIGRGTVPSRLQHALQQ